MDNVLSSVDMVALLGFQLAYDNLLRFSFYRVDMRNNKHLGWFGSDSAMDVLP